MLDRLESDGAAESIAERAILGRLRNVVLLERR